MKLLARRFHWPPNRRQAIRGVIVVAIVVGIAGFVTSGVVAGLSLLLGFPGVLSLILLFLPNRPKVTASLRGVENAVVDANFDGLIVGSEQPIRPFDVEQIVKTQEHAALETMPRAPTPQVPPGAFGGAFDLSNATTSMLSTVSGASDEELRAFMGEVRAYGKELRAWLEHLQAARHESLRSFTATIRVREAGQALPISHECDCDSLRRSRSGKRPPRFPHPRSVRSSSGVMRPWYRGRSGCSASPQGRYLD